MITVPAEFASFTEQRAGAAGRQWIESLPRLVADLCEQWDLQVDGEPLHGGLALVVPMLRGTEPLDGVPAACVPEPAIAAPMVFAHSPRNIRPSIAVITRRDSAGRRPDMPAWSGEPLCRLAGADAPIRLTTTSQ
jgi:hypothetical protein